MLVRQLGDGAEREHPVALQPVADPGGCSPERSGHLVHSAKQVFRRRLDGAHTVRSQLDGPTEWAVCRRAFDDGDIRTRIAQANRREQSAQPATCHEHAQGAFETESGTESADNFVSVSQPGAAAMGETLDAGRPMRLEDACLRDRGACAGSANTPTFGARAAILARLLVDNTSSNLRYLGSYLDSSTNQ